MDDSLTSFSCIDVKEFCEGPNANGECSNSAAVCVERVEGTDVNASLESIECVGGIGDDLCDFDQIELNDAIHVLWR